MMKLSEEIIQNTIKEDREKVLAAALDMAILILTDKETDLISYQIKEMLRGKK